MRGLVVSLATMGLAVLVAGADNNGRAEGPASEFSAVRTESAGVWDVALLRSGQFFYGCRAERSYESEARVAIIMHSRTPEKVFMYLNGPSFGRFRVTARALARVDGGETMVMTAEQVKSDFDTVLVMDYTQRVSDTLKKGKQLTIAMNGRKYTLPLDDTGKMIDALTSCVADGQSAVDDHIFDTAVEATLKRGVSQ